MTDTREIEEAVEAARRDSDFMETLRSILERDREILERLADR